MHTISRQTHPQHSTWHWGEQLLARRGQAVRAGWESLLELHGEEQKTLTAIREVLTGSEAVRWQDQTAATSSTKERTAGKRFFFTKD